jgi:hypothetical protein
VERREFFCFFSSFLQAREAAKSGLLVFHEAMEKFYDHELEQGFGRFERAAAKGHEESIWIGSVLKEIEMKKDVLKEAFAKTEEPLGWWVAGRLSGGRDRFDFFKKSAEAGCSWGQVAYGSCFGNGEFVEQDTKVYVEWMEKAANQNNPYAMELLGDWFRHEKWDKEKAVSYYVAAAELGWKNLMRYLAQMLRDGEGCEKDLRQAAIWGAKLSYSPVFWQVAKEARQTFASGMMEDLDCDFNQLCYSLGRGLYWYRYGSENWTKQSDENKVFGNLCLDFYCSAVERQQKSILTFLFFWNQATDGVKGPGQMIAQMVWEGQEDNLVIRFAK